MWPTREPAVRCKVHRATAAYEETFPAVKTEFHLLGRKWERSLQFHQSVPFVKTVV